MKYLMQVESVTFYIIFILDEVDYRADRSAYDSYGLQAEVSDNF